MPGIRRPIALCSSFTLLLICALCLPVSVAQAAPAGCSDDGPWSREWDDYTAVGLPEGGGTVDLRTPNHHVQLTEAGLGIADAGGGFGTAVLVEWLDGDGCADLVVSAPGRSGSTGSVYILFGSDAGFEPGNLHRIKAPAGAGNSWGTTLAYVDAADVLAVGAPATPLSPRAGGGVWLYPLDWGTAKPGKPVVVTQDSKGVPGKSERGDRFGAALAARWNTLAIGAPGEAVGTRKQAGAVTVLDLLDGIRNYSALAVTQNSPGFATAAEAGDQFGAALDARSYLIAVGVPGESIGRAKQTGMMSVFSVTLRGKVKRVYNYHQNSAGVPGANESGDRWGSAVGFGAYCSELDYSLAVGAPFEDEGSVRDAGSVTILGPIPFRKLTKNCTARVFVGSAFLPGKPQADAHFGWSVRGGYFDPEEKPGDGTWLIGAPGTRVSGVRGAGIVHKLLLGNRKARTSGSLDGPKVEQRYGRILAA